MTTLSQGPLSLICAFLSGEEHVTIFARVNRAWLAAARRPTSWQGNHYLFMLSPADFEETDEICFRLIQQYAFRTTKLSLTGDCPQNRFDALISSQKHCLQTLDLDYPYMGKNDKLERDLTVLRQCTALTKLDALGIDDFTQVRFLPASLLDFEFMCSPGTFTRQHLKLLVAATPNLRRLKFGPRADLTNEDVTLLGTLPLTSLQLPQHVTDAALKSLAHLKLEQLSLLSIATLPSLQPLRSMPLRKIKISTNYSQHCDFDRCVVELGFLRTLEVIELFYDHVNPESFRALGNLPLLRRLGIRTHEVGGLQPDVLLVIGSSCAHLRKLSMTGASDANMAVLATTKIAPLLTELILDTYSTQLTNETLTKIATHFPQLEHFASYGGDFSEEGLVQIARLPLLKRIGGCIKEETFRQLRPDVTFDP